MRIEQGQWKREKEREKDKKERARSGSPALLALRRLKARESARMRGPDQVGTSFLAVSCTLLSFSFLPTYPSYSLYLWFSLLCIILARFSFKLASSLEFPISNVTLLLSNPIVSMNRNFENNNCRCICNTVISSPHDNLIEAREFLLKI